MNSSLQQKWKAISKDTKNASARGEQFQNNVQGRTTGTEAELQARNNDPLTGGGAPQNLTRSQNVVLGSRASGAGGDGGATS